MNEQQNIKTLHNNVRNIIIEARSAVSRTVNFVTVVQNWEIGRLIVEDEQDGETKAEYGKYVIKELSKKLTDEFGGSYNTSNLKRYRQFYLVFPISAAVRHQLQSTKNDNDIKRATVQHFLPSNFGNVIHTKSHPLFFIVNSHLSWSHYKLLITVKDPKAREFYMKEAAENEWGTRALDRQINSFYYERLLSSQEKQPVIDEMKEKTADLKPKDVLKDPLVLEFLDLKENKKYLESELEQALIDKMNEFLLELGKGFAFVARQKRIATESKQFYIDLVFYNYLLKCFVVIDLKTGELTHQDIGQIDMYRLKYSHKSFSAFN